MVKLHLCVGLCCLDYLINSFLQGSDFQTVEIFWRDADIHSFALDKSGPGAAVINANYEMQMPNLDKPGNVSLYLC